MPAVIAAFLRNAIFCSLGRHHAAHKDHRNMPASPLHSVYEVLAAPGPAIPLEVVDFERVPGADFVCRVAHEGREIRRPPRADEDVDAPVPRGREQHSQRLGVLTTAVAATFDLVLRDVQVVVQLVERDGAATASVHELAEVLEAMPSDLDHHAPDVPVALGRRFEELRP